MPFTFAVRTNGSNTFIQLGGDIQADKIGELSWVFSQHRDKKGNFFISTESATRCEEEARHRLSQDLLTHGVVLSSVYFKGKFALALAPDGCRVLVVRKAVGVQEEGAEPAHRCKRPGCTGDCAHCPRCQKTHC